MLKQFLEIGQIVSTHGIKGEVRFNPWCDSPEFIKKFKVLYFDGKGEKPVKIISSRPHGNIVILKLDGIDSVESAQKLRNKTLYINRGDAKLNNGDWFIQDLIGCTVYDVDNNDIIYGELTDVAQTGANDIWYIEKNGKEYIIPAIKDVVINVDVENGKVFIRPLRGIFDEPEEIVGEE